MRKLSLLLLLLIGSLFGSMAHATVLPAPCIWWAQGTSWDSTIPHSCDFPGNRYRWPYCCHAPKNFIGDDMGRSLYFDLPCPPCNTF